MSGLVHEHGHLEPHSLLSPEPMEADECVGDVVGVTVLLPKLAEEHRFSEVYHVCRSDKMSTVYKRCEHHFSILAKKGLTEIAGLDNDGRIWAIDCNLLKTTIQRFYQFTGTHNSFESVLCLKSYEIHIDQQKLRTYNEYYLASCLLTLKCVK